MKTYEVTLPVYGSVVIEVEAESKDAAINKALETSWKIEDVVRVKRVRRRSIEDVVRVKRVRRRSRNEPI